MAFAQNLKYLMDYYHLSKYQLAKELGCHQSSVKNWLSGEVKPQGRTLREIAEKFDLTPEAMTGEELPHIKGQDRLKEVGFELERNTKKEPAGIDADGRERTVTVIGRDGKAEKRVYSKEKYEAIQQLLDNMDYTVMDDDL